MGGCTAHLHQQSFQGFLNDNSAATADDCTSIAAINIDFSRDVDTTFGIRFEIEETANCSSMNNQFHLQRNLGGAGWIDVTTVSTVVKLVDGVPNDALATDNRMTGSALGFVAGEYDEDGTTANITLQNQHTEMHFIVQIVGADVNNNDTIQFRVISGATPLTEYHQTPTVTAIKAGGPIEQSLIASAVASAAIVRLTSPSAKVGTATASAAITKLISPSPLSGSAVASAVLTANLIFLQSLTSSATAAAILSTAVIFGQSLSAGATAAASIVRQAGKSLSASATAAATVVKQTTKTLVATATASAAVSTATIFLRSLSATATAMASLIADLVVGGAIAVKHTGMNAIRRITRMYKGGARAG